MVNYGFDFYPPLAKCKQPCYNNLNVTYFADFRKNVNNSLSPDQGGLP